MQLRAVLLLLILASTLVTSQEPAPTPTPTVVSLDQLQSDMVNWGWAPETALKGCLPGEWAVDSKYRMYFCVPDRNYFLPGHRPYVWLRFIPDPTFLPAGYLP